MFIVRLAFEPLEISQMKRIAGSETFTNISWSAPGLHDRTIPIPRFYQQLSNCLFHGHRLCRGEITVIIHPELVVCGMWIVDASVHSNVEFVFRNPCNASRLVYFMRRRMIFQLLDLWLLDSD